MSASPTVGSPTERLIRRFRFPESLGTLSGLFNFFRISQALEVPPSECLLLSFWMDTFQLGLRFRFLPYGHSQHITKPSLPWLSSLDFRPSSKTCSCGGNLRELPCSIGDFSPGGLETVNELPSIEVLVERVYLRIQQKHHNRFRRNYWDFQLI